MSKFRLNQRVQFSKALVYSKIKFYSEKNFSFSFGPSGLSAQPWPIFFSIGRFSPPLPTRPRPLGWPSSPSRPNGRLLPPQRVGRAPPLPPPGLRHRHNRGAMPPLLRCKTPPPSTIKPQPLPPIESEHYGT
jgi:hypothetical protein